jgi:predicted amidophosphoribosyltransferase
VYREGRSVDPRIVETSGLFRRFKVGDKNVAYPLALGMFQQLKQANLTDFDAIVPIPLSPDKAANNELHRTRALALELGRLLGTPVLELLSLAHPIGKRALRRETGAGPEEFELEYGKALVVDPDASQVQRVLLVDDACTEGSTLEVAASALRRVRPSAWIVTSTSVQMAVKAVVRSEESLLA